MTHCQQMREEFYMGKNIIVKNFFWRLFEKCGAQIVSFIVSIVLARILSPAEYGEIALLMVFMTIFSVFIDSGMGNALIQKKEADDVDFSSVFYFNLVFCILIYCFCYIIAPWIERFYEYDGIASVFRFLSLALIISGVKNVQQAFVSKHMLFKSFFFSTLGGTIISAFVGVFMALMGYGVWALAAQYVLNNLIDTVILWIIVPWKPKKMFSIARLRTLFSFGIKILFANLVDSIFSNIRQLVIGRIYSSSDLAYYNKGKQFPNLIVTNIDSSIGNVMFPAMSQVQDSEHELKKYARKTIIYSSYFLTPMLFGLAACAKPMVELILTEKWIQCVPVVQILCIGFIFYPLHTCNLNCITAKGRSDIILRLEIIKKILDITLLVIAIPFGINGMALGTLLCSFSCVFINAWPNAKLVDYSIKEQIKDFLPACGLSTIMIIFVLLVNCLNIHSVMLQLCVKVLVGMLVYLIASIVVKPEPYVYLRQLVNNRKG